MHKNHYNTNFRRLYYTLKDIQIKIVGAECIIFRMCRVYYTHVAENVNTFTYTVYTVYVMEIISKLHMETTFPISSNQVSL